ncbi:MAG: polysaccharide deacetylase family protein [Capnocytophaga sp.]|nr:polysaccharide deacetylase family protein [Capnocytophaga sp.]
MSKHFFNIGITFFLLGIAFWLKSPIWGYIVILMGFVAVFSWGVFDIRLGYFRKAICSNNTLKTRQITLTFDDGPTPLTPLFLDVLRKYNAKAIFFCIGKNIELYPDIVKQMKAEGHRIGNHTFSHRPKNCFISTSKFVKEIQKTDEVLKQLDIETELFRPPYGITNPHIAKATFLTKKKIIGWNIRSLDTIIKDEKKLYHRIIRQLTDKNIILMHDTSERTLHVLEQLLIYLEKNNFKTTNSIEK